MKASQATSLWFSARKSLTSSVRVGVRQILRFNFAIDSSFLTSAQRCLSACSRTAGDDLSALYTAPFTQELEPSLNPRGGSKDIAAKSGKNCTLELTNLQARIWDSYFYDISRDNSTD